MRLRFLGYDRHCPNRAVLRDCLECAEKSGELRDPNWSANFLLDEIIGKLRCGERRRLVLSNCAIDAYRDQPVKLVS